MSLAERQRGAVGARCVTHGAGVAQEVLIDVDPDRRASEIAGKTLQHTARSATDVEQPHARRKPRALQGVAFAHPDHRRLCAEALHLIAGRPSV